MRHARRDGVRSFVLTAALALMLAWPTVACAQAKPFTVGTITAQPGTIASGELAVPATGAKTPSPGMFGAPADWASRQFVIPFTIINGSRPGPVLALTAGVHGAEYPPILALQRLRAAIDPKTLSGTIIMVHVANMPSYLMRTIYYSPVDGQNLNRVFPGKADGTLSERIAFILTKEVIDRATHLVDLHCGDSNESLRPYLYWETTGSTATAREGLKLALAFGMDHIVIDSSRPTDPNASLYLSNTAITRGKPATTIESGGMGLSDEESIARIERGVAGVLKYLKMRATGPDPVANPVWIGRNQVVTSPATGIFYPAVQKGQEVAEGALLGKVTDFVGSTLAEVRSPFAGEVLYVIGTPPTTKGEPLGFVGERAKPEQIPAIK